MVRKGLGKVAAWQDFLLDPHTLHSESNGSPSSLSECLGVAVVPRHYLFPSHATTVLDASRSMPADNVPATNQYAFALMHAASTRPANGSGKVHSSTHPS